MIRLFLLGGWFGVVWFGLVWLMWLAKSYIKTKLLSFCSGFTLIRDFVRNGISPQNTVTFLGRWRIPHETMCVTGGLSC